MPHGPSPHDGSYRGTDGDEHEADDVDPAVAHARELQRMFDSAPAQIYAKDLDGRYLLCNRDVLALWGMDADDVVGKTDHDLWPEFADSYRDHDLAVAAAGGPMVSDEVVTIDGEQRTYLSLKFPLTDEGGAVYATAGVSADITERAREEWALRTEKEEADRANVAKSEFLSRMSHELRTPLNSILGFGQLLELSDLDEEQRGYLRHVMRAGRHLLDLINEVLDIARIEAGRLTLSIEPVELREVIDEAVTLLGPSATDRSIELSVQVDPTIAWVRADRQRLLQVLLNLLSNAIKYNRAGGSVELVGAPAPDGVVRVSVHDTGHGIPADRHEAVFEVFERLDAEAGAIEGTGVGLALSKRLAELMGATLEFTSELGVGSTFWVDLPVADQLEAAAPDDQSGLDARRGMPGRSMRVLSIEDNLANLALVEGILARRANVELLSAVQGSLGIELAQRYRPDLILLDLHLPDMPGAMVLHELRADAATCDIPVVVISADATPGQQRRLLAAGADAYLTKPIEVAVLLDLVDRIADG